MDRVRLSLYWPSRVTALVVKGKREMGAKPGSVLPTVASKTGISYAPLVERYKTAALQAAGRGSIPLGSANLVWLCQF